MSLDPVLRNPWVRALGLLLALVLVALLAYVLRPVLIPLFMAFLVAYILDPVVDFFEKRRVPRSITVASMAVATVILLLLGPVLFVPAVINEIQDFIQEDTAEAAVAEESGAEQAAQEKEDKAQGEEDAEEGVLARWGDWAIETLPIEAVLREAGWIEKGDEDPDIGQVIVAKSREWVRTHFAEIVQAYASRFAEAGKRAGSQLAAVFALFGRGVVGVVVFFANLALFSFVTGYLLKDFDGVIEGIKELIPPRFRPKIFDITSQIDHQLRAFLRGQLLVCLALGTMYAVGLAIAGTPLWFLLSAFGAVASFIPYVGVVMTAVLAVVFTLAESGAGWEVVVVLVTIALAQTLEGNVLQPLILGDQVGLNPVWVILALLTFGNFLGFLGLLIAVPTAAALKVLVLEAVQYYKQSPYYIKPKRDEPEPPS